MRLFLQIIRTLLPIVIVGACVWVVWWLVKNPPKPEEKSLPPTQVRVEGTLLKKTSYDLHVRSQGTVQPRTRSTLLPEVSGKIVEMSPSFRPGGFFAKDEVLLKLDTTDYETAIVIAKAEVAQGEVVLAEEKARADQARENWKAMGRGGQPSSLVVRAPQLAQAEASLAATRARVLKAERDLERTVIRAPYAGQVMEQSVDVGQFVSQGTVLGRVFAVDYVEIRLPLPERESQFLKLPQPFRDQASTDNPKVFLKATVAGKQVAWEGKVVRVESSLDEQTRQATAVAQVTDPYAKKADGTPPLTIGAFVEADIAGDALQNVYVIPRQAVRAGNEIILIERPQNTLRRMTVDPLVSTEKHIVVSANAEKAPKDGSVLCLTPIPFPADGARVTPTIDGVAPPPPADKEPKAADKSKDGKRPFVSQKADT
ncbi:efflux RND transporter periplasmic adaptor subunit [Brevifollis gellanilyticus]|uniref:RND superfamily efflux pump MFP component n=1 Tax=Brevifollis gellanilyticus TaxID=748831 RepID=A0A512M6K6_9BACT|nr:efflux RND transporter periplasmic adaptor subunit [Brevifollis gellanilyticus]GEP42368.1 RND superfamily efflux pump MFP component [Brevifollis gellanilyticus]